VARKHDGEVLQPSTDTPTPQRPPTQKRPATPAGSHSPLEDAPLPKRCRRSARVVTQKPRELREVSVRLGPREEKTPRYALPLPRSCRGKDWEVVDIGGVYLEEDGSLSCKLLWEPTMAPVTSLSGALLERAEELVKRDHGAGTWDKW
jgi:hypothetical protein